MTDEDRGKKLVDLTQRSWPLLTDEEYWKIIMIYFCAVRRSANDHLIDE